MILVSLTICFQASSCALGTGPAFGANVRISLWVSGGFAATDMQYTIDGPLGRIVGDRCAANSGCDWEPGDVLATVSRASVTRLARQLVKAGFFEGPTDHGTECCDQFWYEVTYANETHRRTVTGSDGTLPDHVHEAISAIRAFFDEAKSPRQEAS